jgi:hypothetical protein
MPRRVLLHIGTHKTGTTSLQHFLQDHNGTLLAAAGAHYPTGFFIPTLHADLPLLTIRPERTWPARIRFPETQRPAWQAAAEAHVRRQVESSPHELLVYSHEDLSYLRFDDELERLRALLHGRTVQVVVCLRDPAAFLRSYGEQLAATGFAPSADPTSFAYVERDSWLVDRDTLLSGYRRWFGDEHVRVVDYDETVRLDGSVIPALAELVGIPRSSLPPLDEYFLNQSGMHLRPTDEQLAAIRQRLLQQAE